MNALSEKLSAETQTDIKRPISDDNIHVPTPRPVQREVSEAMTPSDPIIDRKGEHKHQNDTVTLEDTRQKVAKASRDEWIEQDEPGVYITIIVLPNGQKGLKRVRFR